ncbi:hypothetical protein [Neptuniibacter sp. CAU 1671]|uniref:hypothetical protein n=1 Tax=Neptuniibacter sp. CAU 1671 TaxID=3032593 RepID=UPI0023DCE8F6|nr:hypothetical protein [Neptuniibacter sp. CAU 1671]MDF2181596.1 hypothetical protein [Neptuniibacter sp. CAU 1671]
MKRSLRKGQSSVYLQYENTGESMGAKLFEASLNDGVASISFTLAPVDSNQRSDEDHLHELDLVSVTIEDDLIITEISTFFKAKEFTELQLHIVSKKKLLKFAVSPGGAQLNGLVLNVSRS